MLDITLQLQTHAIKTKLFFHKKAFLVASKNQKVLVEKRKFSELSLPPVSVRASLIMVQDRVWIVQNLHLSLILAKYRWRVYSKSGG